MEEVIFAGRIEKLLERIVALGINLSDDSKPSKTLDESFSEAFEIGTDEYFKHTTAMTPGQSQEIEDVTDGMDLFGTVAPEVKESGCGCGCVGENTECGKSGKKVSESNGVNRPNSGRSFSDYRRKIGEAVKDTIEQDPEIETEDDKVIPGQDQETITKNRKVRVKGTMPSQYLDATVDGLSITSTAASLV
jgi:hypothetical protein